MVCYFCNKNMQSSCSSYKYQRSINIDYEYYHSCVDQELSHEHSEPILM